jgi:hypothetical protein
VFVVYDMELWGDGVCRSERHLVITLDVSCSVVAEDCASPILVSKTFFSFAGGEASPDGRFILVDGYAGSWCQIFDFEESFTRDGSGTDFCWTFLRTRDLTCST